MRQGTGLWCWKCRGRQPAGRLTCDAEATILDLNVIGGHEASTGLCLEAAGRGSLRQGLAGRHVKEASRECGLSPLGKGNPGGNAQLHSRKILLSTEWRMNWKRYD